MRLMRNCPVPVLLTQPNAFSRFQRILAAIDPEADLRGSSLNQEILRQASVLAKLNSAELHVVSAWSSPGFNFINEDENILQYEELKAQVAHRVRETLDEILEDSLIRIERDRVHFPSLLPTDQIVETTEKIKPDLLVMGSVARTGIPGLLIGNTAETVLRQVKCAVLTMKPSGFISGIKVS